MRRTVETTRQHTMPGSAVGRADAATGQALAWLSSSSR